MKPLKLLITIALAGSLAPATVTTPADARPPQGAPATCTDSFLPVSLAPGQPAPLHDSDRIGLGSLTLRFEGGA